LIQNRADFTEEKVMKNKRMFQFAFAGLLTALVLQAVGYRMDLAVPHIQLGNQVVYNWLTLCFAPVAFFLRLGNPDAPLFAGWSTFVIILFSNVLTYAAFCRFCQIFFTRLGEKLAHENGMTLARIYSKPAFRLVESKWKPRRV
jgi:hypothetical protein